MSYADILLRHYAGKSWSILGDDYDGIVWDDESPKPTKSELDALADQTEQMILKERQEANRQAAFQQESDPLFFGWQRGENTEQEWKNKVSEIRARFPY